LHIGGRSLGRNYRSNYGRDLIHLQGALFRPLRMIFHLLQMSGAKGLTALSLEGVAVAG